MRMNKRQQAYHMNGTNSLFLASNKFSKLQRTVQNDNPDTNYASKITTPHITCKKNQLPGLNTEMECKKNQKPIKLASVLEWLEGWLMSLPLYDRDTDIGTWNMLPAALKLYAHCVSVECTYLIEAAVHRGTLFSGTVDTFSDILI